MFRYVIQNTGGSTRMQFPPMQCGIQLSMHSFPTLPIFTQVIIQLKNYCSPYKCKCGNLCNKSQSLRNIFVFSILLLQIFFAKMTQTATTRAYATMVHVHVSRDGTKNLIAQVCIYIFEKNNSNIISKLNCNCSQDFYEVVHISVGLMIPILENMYTKFTYFDNYLE